MANGFLNRCMNYLGLVDSYDDDRGYGDGRGSTPVGLPQSTVGTEERDEEGFEPTGVIQSIDPIDREPGSNVSVINPHVMRSRSTELNPRVNSLTPTEFADARKIADSLMTGQPVVVNLQTANRELKRRMIDFCSGATYALGGGMERVANNVFLITPSDDDVSAREEKLG